MVRKKKNLIILLGIGVILLVFCIFNVYYPSYEGEKRIAEIKAREFFFWRNLPQAIFPYVVSVQDIQEQKEIFSIFKYHALYAVYGPVRAFESPMTGILIAAVGQDKKTFLLPAEFNEVIKREKIKVDSTEKALEVAIAYINCPAIVYRGKKLLYNQSDILGLSPNDNCYQVREECRIQSERLKDVISPPQVILENNSYVSKFFTWKFLDGVVEKWEIKVEKDGIVAVLESTEIASGIGDYVVVAKYQ